VRRLRFAEPMTVTTLTGHRRVPAFGLAGGQPGGLGRHWIAHPDGTVTPMAGCDSVTVGPGDVFVIETPGGGGYGPPSNLPNGAWYHPSAQVSSASSSRSTAMSAASSPLV
jgi:N-methylhydantoinase B/oxoprolinase/acetone carboxylase alpha subunit